MSYGTVELTEHGINPFVDIIKASGQQGTPDVSSVTVDVCDTSNRGGVLVDGFIQNTDVATAYMQFQNTNGASRQCAYRVQTKGSTSNADSRTTNAVKMSVNTISNYYRQNIKFQLWIKFGELQNTNPIEDVAFHWRAMAFDNNHSNVSTVRGLGRVNTNTNNTDTGEVSKVNFYMYPGNISRYRLRCYAMFGV